MISEATISSAQKTQASFTKSKTTDKEVISEQNRKEVEDVLELNVGVKLGEGLLNAKTKDELLSLLKDGQAEAKASIEKFTSLLAQNGSALENKQNYNNVIFNAVKDVVVDILSSQSDPDKKGVGQEISFDNQLSRKLRKNAPEVMQYFDSQNDTKSKNATTASLA
jgi:hypothetical protein